MDMIIAYAVKRNFNVDADSYVLVKCEGRSYKSEIVKDSQEPEWNFSVILYRYKPDVGIKVNKYQRKSKVN